MHQIALQFIRFMCWNSISALTSVLNPSKILLSRHTMVNVNNYTRAEDTGKNVFFFFLVCRTSNDNDTFTTSFINWLITLSTAPRVQIVMIATKDRAILIGGTRGAYQCCSTVCWWNDDDSGGGGAHQKTTKNSWLQTGSRHGKFSFSAKVGKTAGFLG